jgi:hypothetical protein
MAMHLSLHHQRKPERSCEQCVPLVRQHSYWTALVLRPRIAGQRGVPWYQGRRPLHAAQGQHASCSFDQPWRHHHPTHTSLDELYLLRGGPQKVEAEGLHASQFTITNATAGSK